MSLYSVVVWVLILLGMIAIAFGIFLTYSFFKSKKKLPLNLPIGFNFCPQYTQGYGALLELNVKTMANGRTVSTVIPRDLKQNEGTDEKILPKPLYLVCNPGCRQVVAIGDGTSSHRTLIFYLPPRSEKLSRFLQEVPLGQAIANHLDRENIIDMLNQKVEMIRETTSKNLLAGEELTTKLLIEKIPEIADTIINMSKKESDKRKDASGNSYTPMGGFSGLGI